MERLTTKRKDGRWALKNDDGATPKEQINKIPRAIDLLAAYEDTGLGPDEITTEPYGCVFYCNRKCNLDGDFCAEGPGCPYEINAETAKHLLELAQAEKDGRLMVLPCKVEDLLYEIDLPEYGVITCKVLEVHAYIGPDMHVQGAPMVSAVNVSVEVIDGHGEGSGYTFETFDFGKTVFLTREEAEAALKKREEACKVESV